jgi:cation diffusion facilitator family transporter
VPASTRKSLIGALAANLGIATTKFIIGGITGSTVMISEGIHSLVDTGNSGLMMFGRWRSRRVADEEHPLGYGMELYFWSFVVAMVVFGGGGGLSIYQGVHAWTHPREPQSLWLSYLVIGVAAVFEGTSLIIGLREFAIYRKELKYDGSLLESIRASKNPAIFLTVLEDTAALLGLVIAAAGIALRAWTGRAELEAAASIAIGLVLMIEAGVLAVECRGLITGESARPVVVAQLREAITHHGGPLQIGAIRTLQLGPESILVILELKPSPVYGTPQLQPAIRTLIGALREAMPAVRHVTFELTGTEPDPDPPPLSD